jgi:antitoxin Phd
MAWQVQHAKARSRLKLAARPTLKQILLAPGARFDIPVPERGGVRRRQPRGSA